VVVFCYIRTCEISHILFIVREKALLSYSAEILMFSGYIF